MSAWIVSKDHIDLMVYVLLGMGEKGMALPCGGDPSAIGQILWEENHKSVNYRYDENEPTPLYEYDGTGLGKVTAIAAFKSFCCYDYQSCEHPDYENSEAHDLVEEAVRIFELNEIAHDHPGYDEAPWGFERERNVVDMMDGGP